MLIKRLSSLKESLSSYLLRNVFPEVTLVSNIHYEGMFVLYYPNLMALRDRSLSMFHANKEASETISPFFLSHQNEFE